MSRRTRRRFTNAVRVVAPVAIGLAVPGIGAAISGSLGISSALGTAAVTGLTGGVLGGVASRATGGDFRTGAILGGVGGAAGSLARSVQAVPQWQAQALTRGAADAGTARAFGADTSDTLRAGFAGAGGSAAMSGLDIGTRTAFNAARDAFSTPSIQAAPTQGIDLGTAMTLPATQGAGLSTTAPAAALGSQSSLIANAGTPTIGAGGTATPAALDFRTAMTPEQAIASRAIGLAPPGAMIAGGPGAGAAFDFGVQPVNTPDVRTMNAVTNQDNTIRLLTDGNDFLSADSLGRPSQLTAERTAPANPQINADVAQSPFTTIGNSNRPIQLSTTPVSTASGASTVGTPAEANRNFAGRLYDRFTDGERWADFLIMAGTQVVSEMLMGGREVPFDPNEFMPDFGDFAVTDIQGQLSPEEQELYQMMLEDMRRLAEQDQELFLERMNLARGLIGEANYFDPEYWGSRAMAQTRVAAGRAGREAERERALTGRGPSTADQRQREIDAALAGQSAYTEAADTAGGRRLSTMQQAAGMMPSSPPGRMDMSGLTGLSQAGFDRMQQDFQRQLSIAQQYDNARRTAFDIYNLDQLRRDNRTAAAQQGLGSLAQAFMSTNRSDS